MSWGLGHVPGCWLGCSSCHVCWPECGAFLGVLAGVWVMSCGAGRVCVHRDCPSSPHAVVSHMQPDYFWGAEISPSLEQKQLPLSPSLFLGRPRCRATDG